MRSLVIFLTCLHYSTSFLFGIYDMLFACTANGLIKGAYQVSRNGRIFHSFKRIPYAKPPVGDLRFHEPQEYDPWHFVLDATKEPPMCMQRNYLFTSNPPIEGEEDCLYLNVYVPQTDYKKCCPNGKLPVMVFIHWGAFIAGTSTTGYLGPEYFMDEDVILVTFNYRLGPFGFLTTVDDEAPGNYGLKDQVAALKWVQKHIESFGGDKNNVTIFGQSAGAGSVHYHLLSEASEGLFHRAISQSGSALGGWALPSNEAQKQITAIQAKLVGCENFTENSKDLINCLRSVSAYDIMQTQDLFRTFYGNPLTYFGSAVETKTEKNPNPFLTKTPLESILNGEIKKVPWMTGVVKHEGLVRAGSLFRSRHVREALNQNFQKLFSDVLMLFSLSTEKPESLYENVTSFYLNGKEFLDIQDPSNIRGFVNVYSDRAFVYPFYQAILLHSYHNHHPIYMYSFEYQGNYTYADLFAGTNEGSNFGLRPSHCDDLLYLFYSPDLFGRGSKSHNSLSRDLIKIWTKFARDGNPNSQEVQILNGLHWAPLEIDPLDGNVNSAISFLNITGRFGYGVGAEISRGFYKERMKFWTDSDIFENRFTLK